MKAPTEVRASEGEARATGVTKALSSGDCIGRENWVPVGHLRGNLGWVDVINSVQGDDVVFIVIEALEPVHPITHDHFVGTTFAAGEAVVP